MRPVRSGVIGLYAYHLCVQLSPGVAGRCVLSRLFACFVRCRVLLRGFDPSLHFVRACSTFFCFSDCVSIIFVFGCLWAFLSVYCSWQGCLAV
jgi:hypothetical protein